MAQDYELASYHTYNNTTGANVGQITPTPGLNDFIGSVDTDDGTWNVGDLLTDAASAEFQGYYQANGHLFLVFEIPFIPGAISIRSPTAPAGDAGYVANTADIPALNTTPLVYCFLAGSRIATPTGEQNVEDLAIGDLICAADGREIAVKWVGHRKVMTRFGAASRLMPVRLAAGALGDGVPHTDLTVTADHALLVDGVLCTASALVNGASITRVPLDQMGNCYTVYHIETENHDIILANGCAAETFINSASRRVFDNFDEYDALYGGAPEATELPLPRATSYRQLPASVRRRLIA